MSDTPVRNVYRADIDGLRAIAVLAVMIFHARDSVLPGGFIGVDIFFVISGYLISKHIAAEVADGRFSLFEFYRRRIRRIVPMMMVVVAATLAASLLLMTPDDARAVAKSAVWSIASMANIYFWRDLDTGYFANSSAEVPLLHLWSLGVEEQFYFLWPLLLAAGVRKLRPTALLIAATGVAVLSFHLASRVFAHDASFAYYMLPTRMGELLLGAVVGIRAALAPWRLGLRASHAAGWLGAALIAASLWAIDRHAPFPGWLALPPTLGAALLILAGECGSNPVTGLSARPLVFVGKISYSAYLWHWPLFALFRYGWGEPGTAACFAIICATLLLAWLSFEWVERPTRGSRAPFRVVLLRQFAAPAAALLLPSLIVVYAARLGVRMAPEDYLRRLDHVRAGWRPALTFDWVCQRERLIAADLTDPRCLRGAPNGKEPRALLWGDSNAAHYIPMIHAIAERADVRFRNAEVSACPPLFSDPRPYIDARRYADCVASAALVRLEVEKYPVILISAAWSTYLARAPRFLDDVDAMVRSLSARGRSIVLIGRAPMLATFDNRCDEKALRVPFKTCTHVAEPLADQVVLVNQELRAMAARIPNVRYFDANRYLCPNDRCVRQSPSGLPLFWDDRHLTMSGSGELGLQVTASEGVPSAFASLMP